MLLLEEVLYSATIVPDESTRSLIIGAFALTGARELTATQLIALAKPCGVTATNLKSHLTRMVTDGSLRCHRRSRASTYQPSERRRRVMDAIRVRLLATEQPWDGEWLLLLLPRVSVDRSQSERTRRRLEFDGFRPWNRDAFVRPNWPRPWAIERVAVHARTTAGVHWRGTLVGGADLARLVRLYDLDRLHGRARRLAREVDRRTASISSPSAAWARLISLGGKAIRAISEDPLLPPEVWGERTGMRELVAAHRNFERTCGGLAEAFVRDTLRAKRPSPSASAQPSQESAHA